MVTLEPAPAGGNPIDHVQWIEASKLQANAYNPNRVHRPELKLLERSVLASGWVQPILVNPEGLIIDGFHRWRLAQDSKAIIERDLGMVPVAVLDVDRPTAMCMTIRMNRAKGSHVAVSMSAIVTELVTEHGYYLEQVAQEIGATLDEINPLLQRDVFTVRNISSWAYSKAWYPIETGSKS